MKKFTAALTVMLMAVAAWAQPQPRPLNGPRHLSGSYTPRTAKALAPSQLKTAPKALPTLKPGQASSPSGLTAPFTPGARLSTTLPSPAEKAPAITGVAGTYILMASNLMPDGDGKLVAGNPAMSAQAWDITVIDETSNLLGITGVCGGEETIDATYDPATGTIAIPYGQTVEVDHDYGEIMLVSATGAEALTATVQPTGLITLGSETFYAVLTEGDYAGYSWTDFIYTGTLVKANGVMRYRGSGTVNTAPVYLQPQPGSVLLWNFAGEGYTVGIAMKEGGFEIEPQLTRSLGNYGNFYTSKASETAAITAIEGFGNETTLTFGSPWTYISDQGYHMDTHTETTVSLTGGERFEYPVLEEVATTPATPSVLTFHHYNARLGYAAAVVDIPAKDVDAADIKPSLLAYQLYTRDAAGNAIAIGEPIAYYGDGGNASGQGREKTVRLSQDYGAIAVKSIYTAAGERNESELSEWFDVPMPLTPPEGLEAKEYPVTGYASYGGWDDYSATVSIAADGADIYIQGLLPLVPEGWVRGTLDNGVATFPIQYVGEHNGSYVYLMGYDFDSSDNVVMLPQTTFTYDADEDIYDCGSYIVGSSTPDALDIVDYPLLYHLMIGTETVPPLVELPEGAEVEELPFTGTCFSSEGETDFETTLNVARVGADVYIQGLNDDAPEVWVKGTRDAVTGDVVFPKGQNLGLVEDEYYGATYATQFFLVGVDGSTRQIGDVVFSYNEEQNYYELKTDLLVNVRKTVVSYTKRYFSGAILGTKTTKEALFNFNAMDVPTSTSASADGDITDSVTIERGNVTLTIAPALEGKTANRFWSTKSGPQLRMYSNTLTLATTDGSDITGIDFSDNTRWNEGNAASSGSLDGTAWTGSAQTVVVSIAGNTQMDAISVVTTMKPTEKAATPATPAVTRFAEEDGNYFANFDIPTTDVDGNDLLTSRLCYVIWTEKDGRRQPLTLTADLYENLAEDMTEIAYGFTDDYDIMPHGQQVHLNQGEEELMSWTKIGIQTIYRGAGEEHRSDIGWLDLTAYWDTVGIADANTSVSKAGNTAYDLLGRLSQHVKGIGIANGKKVLIK